MNTILVVVANGSRARVMSVRGGTLAPVEELDHPSSRMKSRDLSTDRAGRAFDDSPQSTQRSAMEPPTDPHEVEMIAFAREVARRLSILARRGRYPEVLLMAPPRFLGRVKSALDPAIARRIVASVSHDYTTKTDAELVGILATLGVHSAPAAV